MDGDPRRPRARAADERDDGHTRAAPTTPSSSLLIATTLARSGHSATTRPVPPHCSSSPGASRLLARASGPVPEHTLVLVSTDGGAYGGAGAERFAETSPFAKSAVAVVVLDSLGGRGQPRIAMAGDGPVSPSRTLVRTAAARVAEETGTAPDLAGVADAASRSRHAVRRRRARQVSRPPRLGSDHHDRIRPRPPGTRIPQSVLNGSPSSGARPKPSSTRSTRARAARIALPTASSSPTGPRAAGAFASSSSSEIVPFALGLVDLLVRVRRTATSSRSSCARAAGRVSASRSSPEHSSGWALSSACSRRARPLPLPPYADIVALPPVAGLLALGAVFVAGWLVARRRLRPRASHLSGRSAHRARGRLSRSSASSRSPSRSRSPTRSCSCCRLSTRGSGSRSRDAHGSERSRSSSASPGPSPAFCSSPANSAPRPSKPLATSSGSRPSVTSRSARSWRRWYGSQWRHRWERSPSAATHRMRAERQPPPSLFRRALRREG